MKARFIALLLAFGLLAGPISGCTVIDPGEVGVKTTLGNVKEEPMNAGVHGVLPLIDWVSVYSVKDVAKPDEYSILTRDGQKITLTGTSLYRVVPDQAPSLLSKIGGRMEDIEAKILQPVLLSAVKDIGANNTMTSIIENQGKVSNDVEEAVKAKLGDTPYIDFESFSVTGFVLDPEVQASIEKKQIAAQELAKKGTEIEIASKEAERLRLLEKSLTPEVLMNKALDKWDGKGIPPTAGTNLNLFLQEK